LSLDSSGQFFNQSRCEFDKKQKQDQKHNEFASLIKLYARYRSSRSLGLHLIYAFFGYTAKKSGFSEGRGANFVGIARRHSLGIYLLGIKDILEKWLIYLLRWKLNRLFCDYSHFLTFTIKYLVLCLKSL
ncbi:MAG: hypothetical protein L0G10_11975, partial [Acinetobacter sp.]|nr:hypothetical protein [Acinetobacter sp.]